MKDKASKNRWIVGVTGASGMPYALRLIEELSDAVDEVHLVFSDAALRLFYEEQGINLKRSNLTSQTLFGRQLPNLHFYDNRDIGAAIASGSFLTSGMVVIPCSMGSLGAISMGLCSNLIQRAADVVLKEGRKLVLVPRETPLNSIHLEHLLKLSRMGVSIVPAMPGFYQRPATINELVDMMVMKVLDQMGIHKSLVPRWGEDGESKEEVEEKSDSAELISLSGLKR